MSDTALVVQDATTIELCTENGVGFTLTPTGINVSGEPTLEQYGLALERCGRLANAANWALGDLIIYGEGRGDWGEMYSQYVDLTARSYTTIVQAARVSKEFPPGEMREMADRASWSHHREALRAPREVRVQLLRDSCDYDWTRDELHSNVNEALRSDGPPTPTASTAARRRQSTDVLVGITCRDEESKIALVRWCRQFPDEYQCDTVL